MTRSGLDAKQSVRMHLVLRVVKCELWFQTRFRHSSVITGSKCEKFFNGSTKMPNTPDLCKLTDLLLDALKRALKIVCFAARLWMLQKSVQQSPYLLNGL